MDRASRRTNAVGVSTRIDVAWEQIVLTEVAGRRPRVDVGGGVRMIAVVHEVIKSVGSHSDGVRAVLLDARIGLEKQINRIRLEVAVVVCGAVQPRSFGTSRLDEVASVLRFV